MEEIQDKKIQRKEKQQDMPFEALLERLELVVKQLETGELPLESSLQAYEQGVGLVRVAQERLSNMETKIEELMADGKRKPMQEEPSA